MSEVLKPGLTVIYYCEYCGDEEKKILHLGFGIFDLPDISYQTKCEECRRLSKLEFFFKSCMFMYSLTTDEYEFQASEWRKVKEEFNFNLPSGQVTSFGMKVFKTTKYAIIISQDGSKSKYLKKIDHCKRNVNSVEKSLDKFGYQCEVLSGSSSHEEMSIFLSDSLERWERAKEPIQLFFYFCGYGFRVDPEGFILLQTNDDQYYRLQDFIYRLKIIFDNLNERNQSNKEDTDVNEEEEEEKSRRECEVVFFLDCIKPKTDRRMDNFAFRFTTRGSEIALRRFHIRMSTTTSHCDFGNLSLRTTEEEEEEEEELMKEEIEEEEVGEFENELIQDVMIESFEDEFEPFFSDERKEDDEEKYRKKKDEEEKEEEERWSDRTREIQDHPVSDNRRRGRVSERIQKKIMSLELSFFTYSFISAVEERKGGKFEDLFRIQNQKMEEIEKCLSFINKKPKDTKSRVMFERNGSFNVLDI